MGARDDGDDGEYADSDEYPRHEVTLSSYEIGKYKVTNGQYCEVLNYALSQGYLEDSDGSPYSGGDVYYDGKNLLEISSSSCQISYSGGSFIHESRDGYSMENHPVVEVSWYGSVAFCNWLSEMEEKTPVYDLSTWELTDQFGGGYRLPTEAEWERAAAWDTSSGGKHWIYGYMSDDASPDRMNYDRNNPLSLSGYPYTSPVRYYDGSGSTMDSPSPAGCYDMSGNVWEWCYDWYDGDYYDGGSMTNPTGPSGASHRVGRGGCWSYGAVICRTANRDGFTPSDTYGGIGFRLARSL